MNDACTDCGTTEGSQRHHVDYGRISRCHPCHAKTLPDYFACPECGEADAPSCWTGGLPRSLCFECSFWAGYAATATNPTHFRARGGHYIIGSGGRRREHRGFAGAKWIVRFHDGRTVETDDLWFQGDIPERWRERLPDNAELTHPAAPIIAIPEARSTDAAGGGRACVHCGLPYEDNRQCADSGFTLWCAYDPTGAK